MPPLQLRDYECAVCQEILIDPLVSACGHEACKHCYIKWVVDGANGCPVCRAPLPREPPAICIRLQQAVEGACPEEVAARRRELSRPLPQEAPAAPSAGRPSSAARHNVDADDHRAVPLVLGIAVGTANCRVAVWREEAGSGMGFVETIPVDGAASMPSAVAFVGSERLVGAAAAAQALDNPRATVVDVARLLSQDYADECTQAVARRLLYRVVEAADGSVAVAVPVEGETRRFTPSELLAMLLRKLLAAARAHLDDDTARAAVLTVPAHCTARMRSDVMEAAELAGIQVLRITSKTSALTLTTFLRRQPFIGERPCVLFNMGAGTTSASLMTAEGGVHEVLAVAGTSWVGGRDFDFRLLDFCADEFRHRSQGADVRQHPAAMARLLAACERAKKELAARPVATIQVAALCAGRDFSICITRRMFEDMCEDLFTTAMQQVERVMRDVSSPVVEVVLAGGGSHIAKVRELMETRFPGKLFDAMQLTRDEGAAAGGAAAMGAAVLTRSESDALVDFLLVDVCALSLGIETRGGVMTNVLTRGTSMPTRKELAVTTVADSQEGVLLKLFEGSAHETEDNLLLAAVEVALPRGPRGASTVAVTVEVDANGMVTLIWEVAGTGETGRRQVARPIGRLPPDLAARQYRMAVAAVPAPPEHS